jgi:predicted O-linked N-acetylglucosamine transferase (SPINDLY family)
MGTPVVSLCGATHASRVGASLLGQAGCAELVAADGDDYVIKAAGLASAPARLVRLREGLREMLARSPLMDAAGVTREIEDAFRGMIGAARCGRSE